MILFKRLLMALLLVMIFIMVAAGVYIKYYARDGVVRALESVTGERVTVEGAGILPPFGFYLKNVTIGSHFAAGLVKVHVEVLPLLKSELVIRRIVVENPLLNVFLKQDGREVAGPPLAESAWPIRGLIRDFVIRDGYLQIYGRRDSRLFPIDIDRLRVELHDVNLPLERGAIFEIGGRVVDGPLPLRKMSFQGNGVLHNLTPRALWNLHLTSVGEQVFSSLRLLKEDQWVRFHAEVTGPVVNLRTRPLLAQHFPHWEKLLPLLDQDRDVKMTLRMEGGLPLAGQDPGKVTYSGEVFTPDPEIAPASVPEK